MDMHDYTEMGNPDIFRTSDLEEVKATSMLET
jgi:hypothetical protein